jgi:hypothetical protein
MYPSQKYLNPLFSDFCPDEPLFCLIYNSTNEKLISGTKDKSISLYALMLSYSLYWLISLPVMPRSGSNSKNSCRILRMAYEALLNSFYVPVLVYNAIQSTDNTLKSMENTAMSMDNTVQNTDNTLKSTDNRVRTTARVQTTQHRVRTTQQRVRAT